MKDKIIRALASICIGAVVGVTAFWIFFFIIGKMWEMLAISGGLAVVAYILLAVKDRGDKNDDGD